MACAVFYGVNFCLTGLVLVAMFAVHEHVTSTDVMKSPDLAEKITNTFEMMGLEKAGSFVRRISSSAAHGKYSDVSNTTGAKVENTFDYK